MVLLPLLLVAGGGNGGGGGGSSSVGGCGGGDGGGGGGCEVVMVCNVAYGQIECFVCSVRGIQSGVSGMLSTQSPVTLYVCEGSGGDGHVLPG